jgi:NADPH2:quinone reductase
MKAIRVGEFGGPEVLKVEEVEDPRPGPGQVVVGMGAAGVNPVETYVRSGKYANLPPLPWTPGNDGAGVVEAVGQGVDRVREGDRVYVAGSLSGTYAEKTLCEAGKVHPLPEGVSREQGAAIGVPYGTAWRALHQRARAEPSDVVLVHGATGGVGIAAVQMALGWGCRVIATAGSDDGRKLLSELGVTLVLDHHSLGVVEQVMFFTNRRGVDVILEMLANVNLGKDLTMLARGGRVAVIGSRGTVEINPRDAMGREADIRGVFLGGASEKEYRDMHAGIGAGLAGGWLKPIVGKTFPLAEAPQAHRAVMEEKAKGKIVLLP